MYPGRSRLPGGSDLSIKTSGIVRQFLRCDACVHIGNMSCKFQARSGELLAGFGWQNCWNTKFGGLVKLVFR